MKVFGQNYWTIVILLIVVTLVLMAGTGWFG